MLLLMIFCNKTLFNCEEIYIIGKDTVKKTENYIEGINIVCYDKHENFRNLDICG